MNIPKLEDLSQFDRRKPSFRKQYPEVYAHIEREYMDKYDLTWSEAFYWFYHGLTARPVCKLCGAPVKFLDIKDGYSTYCAGRCAQKDPEIRKKIENTTKERYGCRVAMQSSTVREKFKTTMIERYGEEHALRINQFKKKQNDTCIERFGGQPLASAEVRARRDATCMERYGTTTPAALDHVKQKIVNTNIERWGTGNPSKTNIIRTQIVKTNLERYGVKNPMLNPDVVHKAQESCMEKYGYPSPLESPDIQSKSQRSHQIYLDEYRKQKYPDIEDVIVENGERCYLCKCPHSNCNKCDSKKYIISPSGYFTRRFYKIEPCTNLLPYGDEGRSKGTTIELFVRNILDECGVEYQTNVRSIIPPKELDIFIPSLNIAIECNGIYWHSSERKMTRYHFNKWKACRDRDIQLLTLWEDWIHTKPEIVRSILLNKLGKCNNSIGARLCVIQPVPSKEAHKFLINNHIQGDTTFSIAYGLYRNDELMAMMTFGRKRGCQGNRKDEGWDLSRFCNKLGTRVVGGAGRLLQYFINQHNPTAIFSFSSNDISDGRLYQRLGFVQHESTTSYWYIEPATETRFHRTTFTKANIIKKGMAQYDVVFTEREVMEKYGYIRIDDSGQTKWVLTCK